MGDIYLGLLILAVLDAALFAVGRAVGLRVSQRGSNLVAILSIAALIAYAASLWDQVVLARLLPFSNLVVVGNWYLPAAGWLGGLVSAQVNLANRRRWLSMSGLQCAALVTAISPLLGSVPHCGNQWDGSGICFQTTHQTCSAASAATLLKMHGIDATEQEMAELCLTRNGTSWMGLYRGLKRKTASTDWDVEISACSANELQALGPPAILSVGLPSTDHLDLRTQAEFGWTPGVRHSIVLLGYTNDDLVDIAEPTAGVGRERWSVSNLHEFYLGQCVRLVRRSGR